MYTLSVGFHTEVYAMYLFKAGRKNAGRKSQKMGSTLEEFIVREARVFDVVLNRTQPRYVRIGGAWKPVGKGWVDFSGILPGGRSVNFDAKATEDPKRWTLGKRLLEHQGEHLKRSAKQGAVTFVYLRALVKEEGFDFDYYILPWTEEGPVFEKKHEKGAHKGQEKKSYRWEELARWKMPNNKTWFDAAMNWDVFIQEGWKGLQKSGGVQ